MRVGGGGGEGAAGIWEQVQDIVVFAGPALGLWICGPLMSLIDTMVLGQTSALQLAALGPSPFLFLCAFLTISSPIR
jgi:Na+-driven multidrug efflux pump